MNKIFKNRMMGLLLSIALLFGLTSLTPAQNPASDPIDISHYKIYAELEPDNHILKAQTTVTFKALKQTQSAVFEMNGSLIITSVKAPDGRTELQFIQDRVNELNVKINLGQLYSAGSEITLTFEYSGPLATPEGGPINDTRLAYVGPEGSYLFYAARWFPFHGYVSDRATSEISLTVPENWVVAGHSDNPVAPVSTYVFQTQMQQNKPAVQAATTPPQMMVAPPKSNQVAPTTPAKKSASPATTTPVAQKSTTTSKPLTEPAKSIFGAPNPKDKRQTFTFVEKQPVLVGSFAAGQFITRTINSGGIQIDLFALPGSESRLEEYGKEIAQIISFYNAKFGQYPFGNRYVFSEVDDETLETYSTAGIGFLSHSILTSERALPVELLAREVAYQWWGQAVGLKNFDDAWLWHGLGEYSSVLYRESQQSAAEFQSTLAEILESGLSFEQEASIARAPSQLNDQSPAYRSVVFYKGAYVFHMLRSTIGDDKFFNLIKNYYATYKGQTTGIDDFEALTDKVAGSSMRGFFSLWVDSTGVPEFTSDYTIIRTKDGKFKVRGTVRQTLESFRGPVEVALEAEGGRTSKTTIDLRGQSADFEIESEGKPLEIVVDPDNRYMRISDTLRTAVVVRRGIEHFNREEYAQAEEQFIAARKLNPRSSWAWYNLGLVYMAQQNWEKARDAFTQVLNGDLEPSWVEVWSYIYKGNAYDAEGPDGRERAVKEYERARANGNNYNNAQQAVEKYLAQPYKRERGSTKSTA
ncbi:MAG: M1 family aminopeptidase [Acidobacteriota bacterium]